MSVTDELRRLMDKRGVKHKDEDTALDTHGTLYRVTTTADWVYEEPPSCDLLVRSRYDIGAEDAIEVEATLGRGTCKMELVEDEQRILYGWLECSECGPVYPPVNDAIAKAVAFCPFCGRKVEQ